MRSSKMVNPGSFLFIFIIFKYAFSRKYVDFSWIWTRIIRVEGKHADHLTTTTIADTVCHFLPQGNWYILKTDNWIISGQSYKQFTIVIYDTRVTVWGIFKSDTTLES